MLPKTKIVNGIEVATPEYFNALRAVNFITQQRISWSINPNEQLNYDLNEMIEHVKVIASERGFTLIEKQSISGWKNLMLHFE